MSVTRRTLLYLSAGIFCTFLFLIITLPAYWLDAQLRRVSSGEVRIQHSSGTTWNGSGDLLVTSLGRRLLNTRIAWTIEPGWLVLGKLQIDINGQDTATPIQARLRLGYRSLMLDDVNTTLPAILAAAFHPAVSLVNPTGNVHIVSEHAELTPDGLTGGLLLTWSTAGAVMNGLNQLGDYRLTVLGHGAAADLHIDTLHGDVVIQGTGQWQTQGDGLLQLAGTLVPGTREQNLRPLLAMANAQNKNGQYLWTLTRRLPVSVIFGDKRL